MFLVYELDNVGWDADDEHVTMDLCSEEEYKVAKH